MSTDAEYERAVAAALDAQRLGQSSASSANKRTLNASAIKRGVTKRMPQPIGRVKKWRKRRASNKAARRNSNLQDGIDSEKKGDAMPTNLPFSQGKQTDDECEEAYQQQPKVILDIGEKKKKRLAAAEAQRNSAEEAIEADEQNGEQPRAQLTADESNGTEEEEEIPFDGKMSSQSCPLLSSPTTGSTPSTPSPSSSPELPSVSPSPSSVAAVISPPQLHSTERQALLGRKLEEGKITAQEYDVLVGKDKEAVVLNKRSRTTSSTGSSRSASRAALSSSRNAHLQQRYKSPDQEMTVCCFPSASAAFTSNGRARAHMSASRARTTSRASNNRASFADSSCSDDDDENDVSMPLPASTKSSSKTLTSPPVKSLYKRLNSSGELIVGAVLETAQAQSVGSSAYLDAIDAVAGGTKEAPAATAATAAPDTDAGAGAASVTNNSSVPASSAHSNSDLKLATTSTTSPAIPSRSTSTSTSSSTSASAVATTITTIPRWHVATTVPTPDPLPSFLDPSSIADVPTLLLDTLRMAGEGVEQGWQKLSNKSGVQVLRKKMPDSPVNCVMAHAIIQVV